MNFLATSSNSGLPPHDHCCWEFEPVSRTNCQIRYMVGELVQGMDPVWHRAERREHVRTSFPHILQLFPVDHSQLVSIGPPVTGIGRQIASRGIDFYHTDPLPSRRVVVGFETPTQQNHYLLMDVCWSRFLKQGCYLSGGRFTQIVTPRSSGRSSTGEQDWLHG